MGKVKKVVTNDASKNVFFLDKVLYLFHFFCKSLLYTALSFMIVIIVFVSIYYVDLLTNVKTGKYEMPLFGSYVIVSGSMIPTININDAVLVKRTDNKNLKIGDIITFNSSSYYSDGLTVTHRIVGRVLSKGGKYFFRTKGDNNNVEDSSLVDANNVYGKVLFKIPKLGLLQNFVSKPLGLIICICIPILLVLFVDGYKILNVCYFERSK